MKIKKFVDIAMNRSDNYVVEKEGKVVIIDVGYDIDALVKFINQNKYSVQFCLLTHGHFDHIIGIKKVNDEFRCPIYIHENDFQMLNDDSINMYQYCKGDYRRDFPEKCSEYIKNADVKTINENTTLKFDNLTIKILYTPGHTAGSACYLIEDRLFTGDTIFKNATGRTDLPTSAPNQLRESIKEKIMKLPDETTIYPGHGLNTTIGNERRNFM